MNKKTNILAILFITICVLSNATLAERRWHGEQREQNEQIFKADTAEIQENHQHLILKLAGTGSMYKRSVPGFDEEAMCFDVDLVDMKSDEIIGSATDCLSDVQDKADGLGIAGTTFFNMPEGTFIIRGKISVQPVLEETILESGQTISHITGASNIGNAIIGGTGIYENSTGNVRLSGMVDMTNFSKNEGDLMVFDCLLVIHLDLHQ